MVEFCSDNLEPLSVLPPATIAYESATNELPLSAISFTDCPPTPSDTFLSKPDFGPYYLSHETSSNEMSLIATNERPLSCSCLPKLLAEADAIDFGQFSDMQSEDEFIMDQMPLLSTSDPLPHSSFLESDERKKFSQNFIERLNDVKNCRGGKVMTPKIYFTSTEKLSNLSDSLKAKPSLGSQKINQTRAFSVDEPSCLIHASPNYRPITSVQPSDEIPNVTVTLTTSNDDVTPIKSVKSSIVANSNSLTPVICADTNFNNPNKPHPNIVKDGTPHTTTSTTRHQRHSIAGQMGFFKIMDIAGGFSRKMATSTNSLFSTAVISGSSSAPNLRDMIPNITSPSGT